MFFTFYYACKYYGHQFICETDKKYIKANKYDLQCTNIWLAITFISSFLLYIMSSYGWYGPDRLFMIIKHEHKQILGETFSHFQLQTNETAGLPRLNCIVNSKEYFFNDEIAFESYPTNILYKGYLETSWPYHHCYLYVIKEKFPSYRLIFWYWISFYIPIILFILFLIDLLYIDCLLLRETDKNIVAHAGDNL